MMRPSDDQTLTKLGQDGESYHDESLAAPTQSRCNNSFPVSVAAFLRVVEDYLAGSIWQMVDINYPVNGNFGDRDWLRDWGIVLFCSGDCLHDRHSILFEQLFAVQTMSDVVTTCYRFLHNRITWLAA
jgi:hypothetical protein